MGRYAESDLKITGDGDLVIKDNDFALVHNADGVAQEAMCRLKSADPEWFMAQIGANLEDLLGLDNTEETGKKGEDLITQSLVKDGFINMDDLYVRAVPVDKATIVFFVYFKLDNASEPIGFQVSFNLNTGAHVGEVVTDG